MTKEIGALKYHSARGEIFRMIQRIPTVATNQKSG
jgi:hypothetical protein